MLYRIKNTTEISVFEMDKAGAVSWKAGDMLVVREGDVRVVDPVVLSLFLEPVGQDATPAPIPFVPRPIPPTRERKPPPKGYKRPGVGRSRKTNWVIDGKDPIQVMEGRYLIHLYDRSKPDFTPQPTRLIYVGIDPRDRLGASARVRELERKGFLETTNVDGTRYVLLTQLAHRAIALYGDAMRAAQPAVCKKVAPNAETSA